MPWNQQDGGGPWGPPGGGPQRPRGGGGGGQQPPDFEELLRRAQKRLSQGLPGGIGGGRGLALLILVVVLAWLLSGLYRVSENERGVVLRFGEFTGQLAQPGLNYHLPWPVETALTPKVTRENQIEIGFNEMAGRTSDVPEESLMLTGDANIVDIDFVVQWKIDEARVAAYLFNIRDPETTIKRAAESVMRDVIGRTPIQEALTTARGQIQDEVRRLLQGLMDDYGAGVFIQRIQLQKVDPPQGGTMTREGQTVDLNVIEAFRDVQRAQQQKEELRNNAVGYRNRILAEVRGQVQKILNEADAYAQEQIRLARGKSQRFTELRRAYEKAPEVTRQRLYLETLETVLAAPSKFILDPAGAGSGVVPYLPLDELRRRQQSADGTDTEGATGAPSDSATQNTGPNRNTSRGATQ